MIHVDVFVAAPLVGAIYVITCTPFSKNGSHKGCRYKLTGFSRSIDHCAGLFAM